MIEYRDCVIVPVKEDNSFDVFDSEGDLLDGGFRSIREAKDYINSILD